MLVDWLIQQPLNSCKKNLNVLSRNTVALIIQINQRDSANFYFDYRLLELCLLKTFSNYFLLD